MKFLLFVVVLLVVGWIWSKKKRRPQQRVEPPKAAEKMVVCAHCQLHLPEGESVRHGSLHFCSEAHRQRGASDSKP